jgi:predicted GNAT family acetyltransferase
MDVEIRHDEAQGKFFAETPGGEARLVYSRLDERTLDFRSTYVPPAARGRGLGALLVLRGLAYARDHGYMVVPTCPFVADVVAAEPGYRDLLARR